MTMNIPSLRNLILQGNPYINDTAEALKLIDRIEHIELHAHTYAFYLNLQHSSFDIFDLCAFAVENKLQGVNIHIDAGNDKSISNYSPKKLRKLRNYLELHNLNINIEASSTSKKVISRSIHLANSLGSKNIRVYDRYKGQLNDIIQKCIKRMKNVAQTAEKYDLHFVMEPHEVLKSEELVQIIEAVNSPRVNLLFDFGNMLSTAEQPLEALETMQPYIKQVHLKGANIEAVEPNGFAQIGVRQGDDDLPHEMMLFKLLMLGDTMPQVGAFSLEQQVGYYAPPYRFENEPQDPFIPKRKPSKTQLHPKLNLDENLDLELKNAYHQVEFINKTLENLSNIASKELKEKQMADSCLELQL
ncbi:TIM barrel protein [Flavicella sp.]|uniref:sugar phosphate isomerase/epimerase family protein n=1 Tax=Flavicella sp. TaxID=2957742 RepID=UPI00301B68D2